MKTIRVEELEQLSADEIQEYQDHRRNGDISQGVVKLGGAVAPQPGIFTFGNSTPPPTWSECAGALPDSPPAFPAAAGYARPPSGCRCDIRRPRWYPAEPPGSRPGWRCA